MIKNKNYFCLFLKNKIYNQNTLSPRSFFCALELRVKFTKCLLQSSELVSHVIPRLKITLYEFFIRWRNYLHVSVNTPLWRTFLKRLVEKEREEIKRWNIFFEAAKRSLLIMVHSIFSLDPQQSVQKIQKLKVA